MSLQLSIIGKPNNTEKVRFKLSRLKYKFNESESQGYLSRKWGPIEKI